MKKQIIKVLLLTAVLSAIHPTAIAEAKWKADSNGRWYTTSTDPGYIVGWKTLGKYTYYFTKSKYAATGWKLIQKKWYYFDSKGRLLTKCWIDGYYVTEDGSMAVNTTLPTAEGTYTFDANGNVVSSASGTFSIPGTAENKNVWVTKNGKIYYYDYQGNLAKGFLRIRDKTYYLDPETGARCTGLVKYNKKYYYFAKDSGLMVTGWQKIGKYTYYFNSSGAAATKWKRINGKYYYFSQKGRMYTNSLINKKYYVNAAGERVYGFAQIGNDTYYFSRQTGKMVKGWCSIDSKTYYFDSSGKMITNTWISGRFLKANGRMAKKTWVGAYYVDKNGYRTGKTRSTGLWTNKKKTYYLDSNYEKLKSQWVTSGGKYYYVNAKGVVVKNQWVGNYYVGEDGTRVTKKKMTINGDTYYFTSDGTKATGFVTLNKKTYLFNRNGVMVTGWYNNSVATFYFLPDSGEMVKNQVMIIDNVYYSFDSNGYMTDNDAINSNLAMGAKIAAYATKFIGNPYVYGGTSLTKGADCSGFTQSVMKHFNISIPRTAEQQASGYDGTSTKYATAKIISVKNIQPGDLVFYYKPISHVGIYIGNGKIVHASNSAAYPTGGIKTSNYDYATIRAIVRYW